MGGVSALPQLSFVSYAQAHVCVPALVVHFVPADGRLVALEGGAELARVDGDVCAPLVLLCWLYSCGASSAVPRIRITDVHNELM